MDWIDTPSSSNLLRFAYDAETKTLSVQFRAGGLYEWYDVPEETFEMMKAAPSKGRFLAHIRDSYRWARVKH